MVKENILYWGQPPAYIKLRRATFALAINDYLKLLPLALAVSTTLFEFRRTGPTDLFDKALAKKFTDVLVRWGRSVFAYGYFGQSSLSVIKVFFFFYINPLKKLAEPDEALAKTGVP